MTLRRAPVMRIIGRMRHIVLAAALMLAPCTVSAQEVGAAEPAAYGVSYTLTGFAAALTVGSLYDGGAHASADVLAYAALLYGASEAVLVASLLGNVLGEDAALVTGIATALNFAGLGALLAGAALLPLLRDARERIEVRAAPGGLAVAGTFD